MTFPLSIVKSMHLIALASSIVGLSYDVDKLVQSSGVKFDFYKPGFGGSLRFLTYWGLIFQAVYFTICVLNDFFGTNENHPKKASTLRNVKDFLFATFAFPLAMNVAVSFWGIYAIDRELILPKSFEVFFPTWLNHVMHTNVAIFILLELFTSFRKYPARKRGLLALLIFNVSYLVWVHIIKYVSDKWVYPVLDVLNIPQRVLFMTFMCVFGLSFYYVGEFLNNKYWANELRSSSKSSSKKHK